MPLHVNIAINEKHINTINIGRIEQLYSNTQTSEYIVWRDGEEDHPAHFRHKYDDGYEVCVRKALEALHDAKTD